MTGQEIADENGYPAIVEGYRERQWLTLGAETGTELGTALPLWGPGMIGRLQLDVFAEEGEVRLISTGSPERDIFDSYAHRFRVFVPSNWVGDADDEQMLRRAIEAEKPAHTVYDLCLVEPRFQLDFQSTLGLDTIIGDYPLAYLASEDDETVPPSRQPRNLLGYDTILGASPDTGPQLRLTPATRVGMDTVLT
jgi:hypothetical protein